jgi:hypothetical protein
MMELAKRIERPGSLVEYAVNAALEQIAHELFVTLCARHAPPAYGDDYYPADIPPDRYAEMTELELAFEARLFGLPDVPEAALDWDAVEKRNREWFGWVRWNKPPGEWLDHFNEPIDKIQLSTDYLRDLLAMAFAARHGRPRPALRMLASLTWSKPATTRAALTQARLRASIAHGLRRAESRGETLVAHVPDSAKFAFARGERQLDGSFLFQWEIADAVKRLHKDEYAADEELFEDADPIKLFPLK